MSAIRFEGVTKRFGDTLAVSGLDLEIEQGEFFSLLGPSGCGKTTTLRMVAGFEQPSDGRIYLEGEPVEKVPPYHRNVNTVFQSYALFEHLNVVDNVAFGLKRRKVPAEEIRSRVEEALALVELEGREHARPRELSGGQKQRVALARALVNRPAVLLLDEPLGALDLKLRKQMQVELKGIQREVGITFLYVTHDQEEALALVELEGREHARPRELSGGQKQRVALARALVNRPAVLLLDEPLGALDLKLRKQMQVELKGIQREVGITFLYVTHDQEEALAMSDRIAVMEDGEVRQCGTPEEVYERPDGPFVAGFIGISNLLPGTVDDGGVRLASGQRFTASVPPECSAGSDVYLSVRPEKIWLDESEDGMVSVDGTIVERVYVGTTTQVIVELSPGVRLVALEQNAARQRADDRWEIGQRVRLNWHPEHALVLR